MADSKWLDPIDSDFTDWENANQTVLLSHLWDTLRGAARERVAFFHQSHDSSFPANYDFPDYVTDNSVILASDYLNIRNSVWPAGLNGGKVMNNDDMADGGTVTSNADIPDELQLSEILDELGYSPDTTMLHVTDTGNGSDPALIRMAWLKQWYQIMNYMTWVNRPLSKLGVLGSDSDLITDIEFQQYEINVFYNYLISTSTFTSATCYEKYPRFTSTPTDIYATNDLNESSPFSTMQEVRDYAISQFNPDGATWVSTSSVASFELITTQFETIQNEIVTDNYTQTVKINTTRARFKINDSYRAASPNRFTSDLHWFLYYTKDSGTFSDFGEGFSENDNSLVQLTADGSGWYYLEATPDFDTESVLSDPGTGNQTSQNFRSIKRTISPNMTYTATENSIYQKPNLTDGTAWEWYTPAP